ncbi:MAG: cytochrome C, partial [Burkholderiales bacterium PBB5]
MGTAQAQDKAPKAVYETSCAGCHASGVLDAPKFGDAAAWGARAKVGMPALVKSAAAGTAKGMPPRGGRTDLNDAQLRAVIEYMVAGGAAPATARAPAPAPAPVAAPAPAAAAAPPPPPVSVAANAAPAPASGAEVNAFNRLLKPLGRVNRPAVESGIHDPTNDMTLQLQPPSVAFTGLPRSMAGNHIDWVK